MSTPSIATISPGTFPCFSPVLVLPNQPEMENAAFSRSTFLTEREFSETAGQFVQKLHQKASLECGRLDLNPLNEIFNRMTQEQNQTIKQALNKPSGYFSRLFSNESWEEWLEPKTSLGKVVNVFANEVKSEPRNRGRLTRHLDIETLQRANAQAEELLKQLAHAEQQADIGCASGLVLGAAGSLVTQNPFPLGMAALNCMGVSAQSAAPEIQRKAYFSQLEKEEAALICKYTHELINSADNVNNLYSSEVFRQFLEGLDLQTAQPLSLALKDMLTPQIFNAHRLAITKCFLNVPSDQWLELVKQILCIMPKGTREHDVMWATQILTSVPDPKDREKLIHIANRLFKYDTLTVERGYILEALFKMSGEELQHFDTSDEKMCNEFIEKNVPSSLKELARTVWVYDPVLEKGWDVK